MLLALKPLNNLSIHILESVSILSQGITFQLITKNNAHIPLRFFQKSCLLEIHHTPIVKVRSHATFVQNTVRLRDAIDNGQQTNWKLGLQNVRKVIIDMYLIDKHKTAIGI